MNQEIYFLADISSAFKQTLVIRQRIDSLAGENEIALFRLSKILAYFFFDFLVAAFCLSLSSLILSNNTDAGSSLGSWRTSSPRNALAKMD